MEPELTGRPAYHPATLLKIYVYGYLNRIQSSRRLERECQRNVELIWLTARLAPDFKTIADFRKDNGEAIRRVCREFVVLCRGLNLFTDALVAIDGSKFKAVNNRDKNFTDRKLKARMQQRKRASRATWLSWTGRPRTLSPARGSGDASAREGRSGQSADAPAQADRQTDGQCTGRTDLINRSGRALEEPPAARLIPRPAARQVRKRSTTGALAEC
jgi:transposase